MPRSAALAGSVTTNPRDNLYELSKLQLAGKIKHLGLTNVDLGHLRMLHNSGFAIATNQVSMSVLDRRAELSGVAQWCAANGVGLLAYGTLLGGFVSDKWLGKDEPQLDELGNWSLKKYKRFIDVAGESRDCVAGRGGWRCEQ